MSFCSYAHFIDAVVMHGLYRLLKAKTEGSQLLCRSWSHRKHGETSPEEARAMVSSGQERQNSNDLEAEDAQEAMVKSHSKQVMGVHTLHPSGHEGTTGGPAEVEGLRPAPLLSDREGCHRGPEE